MVIESVGAVAHLAAIALENARLQMPPFEKQVLEVIQGALDRGIEPAFIHRAARTLQAHDMS